MKKIFLTMIITVLVMLVIGNGLGLVYLSYKLDESKSEIENMKYALAMKGIVDFDEVNTYTSNDSVGTVAIEDEEKPLTSKVEDEELYNKYVKYGIENVDKVIDELPDYNAAKALAKILDIDFKEACNVDLDDELVDSKDVWEGLVKDLPEDIVEIINSEDSIEDKLERIEVYGDLAYPILNDVVGYFTEDKEINFNKFELDEEISIKDIKKIKEYVKDFDLDDDEKEALYKVF